MSRATIPLLRCAPQKGCHPLCAKHVPRFRGNDKCCFRNRNESMCRSPNLSPCCSLRHVHPAHRGEDRVIAGATSCEIRSIEQSTGGNHTICAAGSNAAEVGLRTGFKIVVGYMSVANRHKVFACHGTSATAYSSRSPVGIYSIPQPLWFCVACCRLIHLPGISD